MQSRSTLLQLVAVLVASALQACGETKEVETPVRPPPSPRSSPRSNPEALVRSWDVCPLLGPTTQRPGVYGTDLGITAPMPGSNGQLAMLFGDTWADEADACAYPVIRNDDMQASLPTQRPAVLRPGMPDATSAEACASLTYANDGDSFRRIRLFPDATTRDEATMLDMSILRTPSAAFSDGQHMFAIFIRHEHATCFDDTGCPTGMICSTDRTYRGRALGACQPHLPLTEDEAPVLCLPDEGCAAPSTCEPLLEGRCLAPEPFASATGAPSWYADDPRRALAQHMVIASAAWADRPEDYAIGARFTTHKFSYLSARTVAHFDPERPETNDYRPGDHTLLLFGRPHVIGEGGFQSLMFLLAQPLDGLLDASGAIRWAPKFFAGYASDGRAIWSDREVDAQPVYGGHNPEAAPEFDFTNLYSVAYVEALQRWVLFYGGSVPAWLAADAASGELWKRHHAQSSPGAIYQRSATHPWGKLALDAPDAQSWSEPRVVVERAAIKQHIACDDDAPNAPDCAVPPELHRPAPLAGVLAGFSAPPDQAADVVAMCLAGAVALDTQYSLADDSGGHLYGANIIESWTEDVTSGVTGLPAGERAVEVYWNISTWNPYQVVLMKTQLRGDTARVY